MTVESCTSTCAQKGFTMAGIEYGDECHCEYLFPFIKESVLR